MSYKTGEEFLNKLYKDMHMSDIVMHTAQKSDTPAEKITRYMERLENVHEKAKSSQHSLELLKKLYYDKYIIKELPESYINLQKKIAREDGHGDIVVTEEMKRDLLIHVQKDQKESLDSWIEYFISDDAMYPMWFKNYAFQGMLSLSKFDKEKGKFKKRTQTTTEPFLELNREILAQVYNILSQEIGDNNLTNKEKEILDQGESFKKLYTYYLRNSDKSNYKDSETIGIWKKYDQGSDYELLWATLQGKNTGWCTAGKETCKNQIENGDFYVYYTKDNEELYTNPRIAIRMDGTDSIGEVRGIGKDQNLESSMADIADKKLDEFPDKEKYKKKMHDMKLLTEIERKNNDNIELTSEELIFLYEIDSNIEGFGWGKDPRIKDIKQTRNLKRDLACIYDCKEENIGVDINDLVNKSITVYYGNISIDNLAEVIDEYITTPEQLNSYLTIPKIVLGSLDLSGLTTAEGLNLPEKIGGNLNLESITIAEGLQLPKEIGGDLVLCELTTAEGLQLPEEIGGDLNLIGLTTAEGWKLPEKIGGSLYLGLTTAEGLQLPEEIGGDLSLFRLTTAEGLKLPKEISGDLNLESLTTAEGLKLSEKIGGDLDLSRLVTSEGLVLPEEIGGHLNLRNLTTVEGLQLPKKIGRNLELRSLKSANGLNLPEKIGGDLDLRSLKSANGLILPEKIGGDLILVGLTTAEGLMLPEEIGDSLLLFNSTSAKGLVASERMRPRITIDLAIEKEITFLPDDEYKAYREEKRREREIIELLDSEDEKDINIGNQNNRK